MADDQNRIDQLQQKLDALLQQQADFSQSIEALKKELDALKWGQSAPEKEPPKPEPIPPKPKPEPEAKSTPPIEEKPPEVKKVVLPTEATTSDSWRAEKTPRKSAPLEATERAAEKPKVPARSNWEKFIGENLINKVGIVITVIGVGIGVKYSIDHNLINPLTRIIFGFVVGLSLIGVGIRLKKNYLNYSAVLVSGAMAILYFNTYAAYDFYHLIPRMLAFALMLVYTGFTVFAALQYNRQIIAHLGLVGAYAVPFLLSNNSGQVEILFTYMAIINLGILAVSIKRHWKMLYVSSFSLTWLIYLSWNIFRMDRIEDAWIGLIFGLTFFVIFYATFLAYKIINKESFQYGDVVWILVNSFLFYMTGYSILVNHDNGDQYLGLFTLFQAILHFGVSVVIYQRKLADRNLFYLVSGLVLLFLTLAIPVQLDGNWVTLLWVGQAALLFTIGRKKQIAFYERLSYPLIVLAFFSLVQDWGLAYDVSPRGLIDQAFTPVFNIHLASSVLFIGALAWVNRLHFKTQEGLIWMTDTTWKTLLSVGLPALMILSLFIPFYLEMGYYFDLVKAQTAIPNALWPDSYPEYHFDPDIRSYKAIWLVHYTLLFLIGLSWVNIKKVKSAQLGIVCLLLNALALVTFLTLGLFELSELREAYLHQDSNDLFISSGINLFIRYLSIGFVAALWYSTWVHLKQSFLSLPIKMGVEIALHATILWVLSSELLTWMDVGGVSHNYKLGLSILSGTYCALVIAFGIWKKKTHLRIAAMVWFAVVLLKLFFYDIAHLNTLAKTIVFLSLGVLLLITSFLYNKYKNLIFPDE